MPTREGTLRLVLCTRGGVTDDCVIGNARAWFGDNPGDSTSLPVPTPGFIVRGAGDGPVTDTKDGTMDDYVAPKDIAAQVRANVKAAQ